MDKKVRTIIIDGVEIQTSLTAVEIANLPLKIAGLQQRIDKAVEEIQELYNLYKDDNCYTIGDKLENALNILKGDDTNE